MAVQFDGLRPDDPPGQLKVVGWGSLAQDLQNRVQVGQRLMVEGRLRMNTVTRQDGVKEKRAEFTLSRLHAIGAAGSSAAASAMPMPARQPAPAPARSAATGAAPRASAPVGAAPPEPPAWNASPLVPDLPEGEDEIPF
jgi:single-stranded DNA-binding protein